MTVKQKTPRFAGLMPAGLSGVDGLVQKQAERRFGQGTDHIAALGMLSYKTPMSLARSVNEIQPFLFTNTSLHIPATLRLEALNGVVLPGLTYPAALKTLRARFASERTHIPGAENITPGRRVRHRRAGWAAIAPVPSSPVIGRHVPCGQEGV
ncbi:hypothetical protein Franean1_3160 [Parafrankia sp. EAN1pec]|uniref:hypothetical protein n=1 Tax=Parafrankia sp. (strain EAN1pec) TaxID=298653 RepID=UPI000054286E|nr:hypothetical protein Franean1_3160 [Frankia sp. EAN1pec]